MDVYEFTQALRRQKRFLAIGSVLLACVVLFLTFEVSSGGLQPRIDPRYMATVKMVVAPAGADSLSDAPTDDAEGMAENAAFFTSLLLSPDATLQIEKATETDIEAMTAFSEGPALTVTTTASTPEGAKATALASFDWLGQRLSEPASMIDLTTSADAPSLLDEDGNLSSSLIIDASPAFVTDGDGLWLEVVADDAATTAVSLVDAGTEPSSPAAVVVRPGGELALRLEDVDNRELDAAQVAVPELPGPDNVPYVLTLRIDRGAVAGVVAATEDHPLDVSGAELILDRVDVDWQPASALAAATGQNPSPVGLILATDDPIPLVTGARKGPIITMGALFGGLFALVAMALAIDSWKQAHHTQTWARSRERLAVIRPMTPDQRRHYHPSGPLSTMVTSGQSRREYGSSSAPALAPSGEPDTEA